ncbi:hypothetical protein KK103_12055 [Curtobacterium flaccumfaciens pv. flaccumfaciens]|uniref:Uncharacterized protein n=1 Tax=Curtobacterium flaccumfaciens pv. flaccumfaciens TaxID=138532 RepID=A0A9Q2ZRS9_9MICO|nr:hypothetical protein [Curtobacterium flaccumfaciens pv. flaccumfaciens]
MDTNALRRDARVLSPGFPGVEKRLIAAADEVDRLRTLIADQQHDDLCAVWMNGGTSDEGCTCWKADVL